MDANNKSPLIAAGALIALLALAFVIAFAVETSWLPLSLIVFAVLLIVLDVRAEWRIARGMPPFAPTEAKGCETRFPGLNSQLVPRPRIFEADNHA
jgi:hypothetical protein